MTLARVDVLCAGYARADGVASTVGLVRDGDSVIVIDPGMVADRAAISIRSAASASAPSR